MAKHNNRYGNKNRAPRSGRRRIPPPPPPGTAIQASPADGSQDKKKRSKTERLLAGGILTAVLAIFVSLLIYFRPSFGQDVFNAVKDFCRNTREQITNLGKNQEIAETTAPETDTAQTEASLLETEEELPYMDRTAELGNISDMGAEPVYPPQEDAIYSCMLDTAMGPLLYYNQGDIRWKEYLYGGRDRLAKYGCGPVCVSMLINSFTPFSVTPVELADWSAANGYYAPQSGSYHGLIPGSLTSFGLQVESVTDRTPDNARNLLSTGHVLVALMGRGALTQNGHFIIIAQLSRDGNVYIADPASYENSTKEWDLALLMNELKKSYDSGGPLWAVSFDSGEGG
ncbi:MAG: hypothetical protein HFG73_04025 [Hungatella sp.]|nr:hypothetical protein [Hungatella sp.]